MVSAAVLPRWQGEHPTLEALARLPMHLGADFAAGLYDAEGSAALDAHVLRPPRTTEQILHPDRYNEATAFLALDPMAVNLDAGWTLTGTWRVGEALMGFTLEAWAGESVTTTVTGWNGDLLQVWDGPEGARVWFWRTQWDSRAEAQEFARQLATLLPERVAGARVRALPEGIATGSWWEGRGGASYLRRRVDAVWLVWGTDGEIVEAVVREVQP